ncbi:MAG: hypothetical protein R3F24_00175 [Gammaproteobacteria bacterium]
MAPDEHPLDPLGWQRKGREDALRASGSQGLGVLAIPFTLPVLIPVALLLNPLTAAAFAATALVGLQVFPAASRDTSGEMWLVLLPALVVFWLFMRLESRIAELRMYWWLRHVYRLLLITGVLIYLYTLDTVPADDIALRLQRFFGSYSAIGMSVAILLLLNYVLVGDGFFKNFWHGMLEFLRMRPRNL